MGMALSIVKWEKLPSGKFNVYQHCVEKNTYKLYQLIIDWVIDDSDEVIVIEGDESEPGPINIYDLSNKCQDLISYLTGLRDDVYVCSRTAYVGHYVLDRHNGGYKTETQFETAIKSHLNSLIDYVKNFQDEYTSQWKDGYRLIMT